MNRFVGAVPATARLAVTVLLLAAMGGFLALGWGAAAVLAAYATLFVLAAFPPDPRWKLAALAVLTLEATLGLASKIGGDLLFIALVGVLVLLLRLPKVAVWLKVLLGAAVLLFGIPISGFAHTFFF